MPTDSACLTQVTAVIPCHNGGPWLEPAVASCIAAGVPESNIVVVDDGSTDGAVDDLQAAHPEVVLERHASPQGVARARQAGARHASTPWTVFLDADDYLVMPGFLNAVRTAERLTDRNRRPSAVVGNFVIDTGGVVQRNRLWFARETRWHEPRLDLLFENVQIGRWLLPTSAVHKAPFRVDVGIADDLTFVSDIAGHCPVFAIPETVLGYRVHAASTSADVKNRLSEGQVERLRRHLEDGARASHGTQRAAARRASSDKYLAARDAEGSRRARLFLQALAADPTALRSGYAARTLLRGLGEAARGTLHKRTAGGGSRDQPPNEV